jgi:D-glycero-alpha-D-manno-heptose 1-phosphate guanylyltransferase
MTSNAASGLDVIVLAGGLGTRLREVLPGRQKVTAPVSGEPFLTRLLQWLADAGIGQIVLAAGHRAADVEAVAAARASFGPTVQVSIEPVPLGTGGAARLALPLTDSDPVLVVNGDSFADIDLAAFRAFHSAHRAQASLALVAAPEPSRYGAVKIDANNAVVSFEEKPDVGAQSSAISAGIYLFERATLAAVPGGKLVSLEREIFPDLIGKGLYAILFNSGFIDIGTPESLRSAAEFFRARGKSS